MKIGLVSPYDWSYPGGVQEHIQRLATELRGRGHSVRILTPATGAQGRQVEYGVYKVGWAAPLHVNGSIARVAFAPHISGRLRGILQREQFDIIHLHEPLASPLGLYMLHAGPATGATLIGTFHAWARHSLASAPEWAYASAAPFLGRYSRRLDGRIAVSPAAEEFVSRFFPGDYRIIPNGVDTQLFRPDTPPLPQFDDGKLNVVYFGRIEKRKGLKFLLRAIPMIREHFPNTRFIIGGDGPLRAGFERLVAQAGWQDVVFLGRVPAEQAPAIFTSAHVFCAPNIGGESQGIVLLEALASGRAVVASDIPGFRSVIESQRDGLLTPPRRSEELAWAICHLLSDEVERMRLGKAGRQRAEAFSWERVATQVLGFYEERRAIMAERQSIYLPAEAASISLVE
ncbi:MAG TPA: glycosyltransferase family 4 protein [Ktedonobacterales bacterium]|nr:glycosyltransferase family 4 protein [Ktedonobacterales bacterium]